jgi:hypothetical protein
MSALHGHVLAGLASVYVRTGIHTGVIQDSILHDLCTPITVVPDYVSPDIWDDSPVGPASLIPKILGDLTGPLDFRYLEILDTTHDNVLWYWETGDGQEEVLVTSSPCQLEDALMACHWSPCGIPGDRAYFHRTAVMSNWPNTLAACRRCMISGRTYRLGTVTT